MFLEINKENIEDAYPMSDIQTGMVYHSLADKSRKVYDITFYYSFYDNEFQIENFKRIFSILVERHSILRTTFSLNSGKKPLQIVHKKIQFNVPLLDISEQTEKEKIKSIEKILNEEKNIVFEFKIEELLWRISVIKINNAEYGIVWKCHHAIIDGWSTASLMSEFTRIYSTLRTNSNYVPSKLKSTYKDFLIDQLSIKKDAKYLDFWKEELKGIKRNEMFSLSNKNDASFDFYGNAIKEDFLNDLRKAAVKNNTSIKSICFAAYVYMLYTVSYENDLCVGLITNNRPVCQDSEKIIGCFLNTVPFRFKIPENISVKEFVGLIHSKLNSIKNYERVPLADIKKHVQHKHSNDSNLFDTSFNYVDFHVLNDRPVNNDENYKKSEISNHFNSHNNQSITGLPFEIHINTMKDLKVKFYSNKDLFLSSGSIKLENLFDYFKNILKLYVNDCNKVLTKSLISGSDSNPIFNGENRQFETNFLDKYKLQIQKRPDNIAVFQNDINITYSSFDKKVNSIYTILKRNNVKPNCFVGVLLERSIEYLASVFAIIKAGAAFVPISEKFPIQRINFILNDCSAKWLITSRNIDAEIDTRTEKIYVEDCFNLDEKQIAKEIPDNYNENDIAYSIYTSGSTGLPKGVIIEYKSLNNILNTLQELYPVHENDTFLFKTSKIFDVSVTEIFGWVFEGAKVAVLDEGLEKNPEVIQDIIQDKCITHINFVPSLFKIFTNFFYGENVKLKNLKYIFIAGEALPVDTIKTFKSINDNIKLVNIYGPTESTIYASNYNLDSQNIEFDNFTTIPIGKALDNTKLHILNRNLEAQPNGIPGELCISGSQIARGYLNNMELSNKNFITNPFNKKEKLYRTGDLVKLLPDNNILFIDRLDEQVKIRGLRIELGEIESLLKKYRGVKDVVCTVYTQNESNKYICAYIKSNLELEKQNIKEYLSAILPDYMVPTYFVFVDDFPLNSSGKIDKTSLPRPEIENNSQIIPPSNPIEKELVKIWAEVLEINPENIGVNSNFYEIGGHSLNATILAANIHKTFNKQVSFSEILKAATIREMSTLLETVNVKNNIIISLAEKREFYELSSAQRRLYFLNQFSPKSTAYNIPMILKLKGEIDVNSFEDIFKQIISRHEALRTNFRLVNNEPVQIINENFQFNFESYKSSYENINNLLFYFIRPFNLENELLIRAGIIEISKKEYILAIDIHHIISDAITQEILIDEFAKLYRKESLGRVSFSYKDYSNWVNSEQYQKIIEDQKEFWKQKFNDDLPVLNIQTDHDRPPVRSNKGERYSFQLSKKQSILLKQIRKEENVTDFILWLAIYNVFLSKLSNQEDIIIGTPITNRKNIESLKIAGVFINSIALRNNVCGDYSFQQLLQSIKEETIKAYEHQDYQFEDLIDELSVNRDSSRNPLFDVMLIVQELKKGGSNLHELEISPYQNLNTTSKFDLTMQVLHDEERFNISFEYSTDLFKKETILKFEEYLKNTINSLFKLSTKIKDISLISINQRNKIQIELNKTDFEYPQNKCIPDLLNDYTGANKDKIAITCKDESITYIDLKERSDAMAQSLIDNGISSGDIVAILLNRSIEMFIAIYGILKSGAAYLPLEPNYPEKRIKYILQNSEAKGIIISNKIQYLFDRNNFDIRMFNINEIILNKIELKKKTKINIHDTAYLIYTSGSTGEPKGISISHANVANFVCAINSTIEHNSRTVLISLTTITFDIFVLESIVSNILGIEVAVATEYEMSEFKLLSKTIRNKNINLLQVTPSRLRLFVNDDEMANSLQKITSILVGGEAFPKDLLIDLKKVYNGNIYNMYGPTETTVWSSIKNLTNTNKITIGKPVANTQFYVIDKYNNIQPENVEGELCISGDGLSKGYWKNDKLSDSKFITDPFRGMGKMFKTGDLVKLSQEGEFIYVNRKDFQVKIRGYRIELEEIENVMIKHPKIEQIVVMDKEDNSKEKYLCAYIKSVNNESISDVRNHIVNKLPDYMIPSFFIYIDNFPLLPSGKINRKKLPDPTIDINQEIIQPRNETEDKLLKIWSEILNIDSSVISINKVFFEIGGHSIKLIALKNRISNEFNLDISIIDLVNYNTIELQNNIIQSYKTGSSELECTDFEDVVI